MTVLVFVIAAIIIGIDQLLKFIAVSTIKIDGPVSIFDGLVRFIYVENKGAAFGMLENQRWIFITITVVVIALFIYYILKKKITSKLFLAASALLIGGGVANLIDRIFLGYVVDYLQLSFFSPVCNFADYCVVIGTGLLIIYVIFFSDAFKKQDSVDKLNG